MMIKNVIVINDHASINGGQAKVAIQSAVGLAKRGLNVVFFAGAGPVSDLLTNAGIRTVCLDQADIGSDTHKLRAMSRGVWNAEAGRRLKQLLDEFDPKGTIVHCHGFAKLLSGAVGAVLTKHRLANVLTMHEYTLACPNGGFFHFPENEICTRRPLGVSCLTTNCDSRRALYKGWRVVRQLALNGPGRMPHGLRDIIFISHTQRRAIEPYLGNAELHYVCNPVEIERTPAVDVERNESFLLIGRLSREKGCTLFAQAARKAGVKAVFVGDGEEVDAILKANPDATITGWQTPNQVVDWMAKSRAVVFSSLWYECQPLVPLEALSRGVPVIAGSWSAASESIQDEVNGLHLSRPDPELLASILSRLTPQRAAELGRRGYDDYWRSPPSLDAHVASLLQVYEKVLAKTGNPANS